MTDSQNKYHIVPFEISLPTEASHVHSNDSQPRTNKKKSMSLIINTSKHQLIKFEIHNIPCLIVYFYSKLSGIEPTPIDMLLPFLEGAGKSAILLYNSLIRSKHEDGFKSRFETIIAAAS